jgi:hypothetical protein
MNLNKQFSDCSLVYPPHWSPHSSFLAKSSCLPFKSSSSLSLSRLGTYYLCGSSKGLNNRLELEVIDEEQEMGDGKAGKAEDNGGEVG